MIKIRKAVIGLKPRPRGRYKKKKHDLILYLKIALICYLTIFGVGYMSSDTSAYLSSQVEFSETITAGEWVVPGILVNACGEELTIDEIPNEGTEINNEDKSDEEINVDHEDKADNSIGESEKDVIASDQNEVDCGDQSAPSAGSCNGEEYTIDEVLSEETDNNDEVKADSSIEEIEKDVRVGSEIEVDCGDKSAPSDGACNDGGERVAEVTEIDSASNKEVSTDCKNNGDESSELVCNDNGESLVGENQEDATSSERVIADCNDTGDESNEKNDNVAEGEETPDIDKEAGDKTDVEDGNIEFEKDDENKVKSDDSKADVEQNPTDESQNQPESNGETITESEGINPTDQDSQTTETLEISID